MVGCDVVECLAVVVIAKKNVHTILKNVRMRACDKAPISQYCLGTDLAK